MVEYFCILLTLAVAGQCTRQGAVVADNDAEQDAFNSRRISRTDSEENRKMSKEEWRDLQNERLNLKSEYRWLLSLSWGGFALRPCPKKSLKKYSVAQLRKLARQAYVDIQCGLVGMELLHARLTGAVLTGSTGQLHRQLGAGFVQRVLYIDEAVQILRVCHGNQYLAKYMDVFWIYYVYQERAKANAQSVILSETAMQVISPVAHNAVTALLEEYVGSGRCTRLDPEIAEPQFPEDLPMAGKIRAIVDSSGDLQDSLRMIEDVKGQLSCQMRDNERKGLSNAGTSEYLIDKLGLHGVIDDDTTMDTLAVTLGGLTDWQRLRDHMRRLYTTATDHGNSTLLSQQIRSLAEFQLHFVYLLKAIMLRIVLKHLAHLTAMSRLRLLQKLYLNLKLCGVLKKFAKFLGLDPRDKYIGPVIAMFDHPAYNNFTAGQLNSRKRTVVMLLKNCSLKLNLLVDCSDEINLDEASTKRSMEELRKSGKFNQLTDGISESVLSARIFLKCLQDKFHDINFVVFKSFMSMRLSESYDRLNELEKIEIDNFNSDNMVS